MPELHIQWDAQLSVDEGCARVPVVATTILNQLPNSLPAATYAITSHDNQTKKAIFLPPQKQLAAWHDAVDGDQMSFFTLYHTQCVPGNHDKDFVNHHTLMTSTPEGPELVVRNGTVARMVDFAPGYSTVDHRSLSLDYGVLIEGELELVLDSGETMLIERGSMVVQRGTMHKWHNPSKEKWARMFFVLVSAQPVVIGEHKLEEDLGGL